MSFDWNDYIILAKYLNGESFSQDFIVAKYRTAISRAYYAAFNICKDSIEEFCGIDLESEKIKNIKLEYEVKEHGLIPKLMQTSDNSEIRVKGSRLNTLKSRRVHADYKSEKLENITRKTQEAIEEAEKIIAATELFKNGSADIDIDLLAN